MSWYLRTNASNALASIIALGWRRVHYVKNP